VQARYYREALKLAYCQPTVAAFLIFHVSDERDLDRWQSGLFYADDTPKTSLGPVHNAVAAARAGHLTLCNTPLHLVAPRAIRRAVGPHGQRSQIPTRPH
jgi:hypothetical protein